ncbi:MAG: hypothetical protein ACLS48_01510 [[Eubacterium] siraeum]
MYIVGLQNADYFVFIKIFISYRISVCGCASDYNGNVLPSPPYSSSENSLPCSTVIL